MRLWTFLALLVIGGGGVYLISSAFQFWQMHVFGHVVSLAILVGVLLMSAWLGLILFHLIKGLWKLKPDLWKADANSVSNFSFIFAILFAYNLYHLMPPASKPVPGHVGWMTLLLNREFLCMIAFWSLWLGLKFFLRRLLELNRPVSPPPTDDPDIPEFPQKSPLIPL